ncbi:hypothetical protein OIU34_24920 [Pararhizobium sp. BT-229]|uniref:hypothetical protein n=1 Tax=Pararhizobium sp. BT-229 TaxID=2986923 RepID=UPI0021F73FBE|nr:hypothetical protein [Pararhizobium sp. BT-229]MCV9965125.1 hypothetical protein [Pararhizobium sp. BT-229]
MSIKATVLQLLRRQTREQYQIIEAVDVFGRSVTANSQDEQISLREALSAGRFVVARNSNPSRQLLVDMGWSPLDAAALFILQWCRRELQSGRHHVYRGVLMGKGEGYRMIFDACLDCLSKAGRYDEARVKHEQDALAEAIQQAGGLLCDWSLPSSKTPSPFSPR